MLKETGLKLMGIAERLRKASRSMVGLSGVCSSVADELEREAADLLAAAADRPAHGSDARTGAEQEADGGH